MRYKAKLYTALLVAASTLLSCTEDIAATRYGISTFDSEVWVCHNPKSEYHGHLCNDECYWVGQQLVESSYCWTLYREDCKPPLTYQWQRENCHFFD